MVDTESEDAFKQVCEVVRNGEAVLWVGAGFSKYAGYPLGSEFGKDLAEELGEPELADILELPDIAEQYKSAMPRHALKEKIGETFGKEPNNPETHRLLSLIKRIPYIVTTNYDCLIEDAFGDDIIVIVTDEEMGNTRGQGYGNPKPILYKPHGDIKHLDHVVITRSDYDGFDDKSLLWSRISALPAEYQIIFIGYALTDGHAQDLLTRILIRLGPQQKPHIIINKDITADDITRYSRFELQWIEKGAAEAIREIKDYVTRYSLVDAGTDPARVHSCMPLLRERNMNLGTMTRDGKIVDWSVSPIDPTQPIAVRYVVSKPADFDPKIASNFRDLISGNSFDPYHITLTRTQVELNGIIWAPPTLQPITWTLTRRPDEEFAVDLQVGSLNTIPGVLAKRYVSNNKARVILTNTQFELTINIEKDTRSGEITLKIHPTTDIETGRRIYSFFNSWIEGEPIAVIPVSDGKRWIIPSNMDEDTSTFEEIRFWHRFYQDLSDIQKVTGKPLIVPNDGVTDMECQVIADAGAFIRGERRIQGEIKLRLLARHPDAAKVLTDKPVDIEHSHPDYVESFEILDTPFSLPFIIGGRGLVPSNLDEAVTEAASGAEMVTVIYDGSVGELYQRYLPPSNQNGDMEMTSS